MKKSIALFVILSLTALPDVAAEATANKKVVINGTQLTAKDIQTLERSYGVPMQTGRYWYDKMSGLWGYAGQPTAGQIYPGLQLGGLLKANASNGNTGVFINGRELPMVEVTYLQQLGTVYKGRYWMNALGVGGIEGGPAIFDLGAAARQRSRGGSLRREQPDHAIRTSWQRRQVLLLLRPQERQQRHERQLQLTSSYLAESSSFASVETLQVKNWLPN